MERPVDDLKKHHRRQMLKRDLGAWTIMLPTLVLFAFFLWVPIAGSVHMSFFKGKGLELVEFIGLDNYKTVFAHPDFLYAVRNTFLYIFWSLVLGFWVPILMAALVTESLHWKSFFRASVYFPNILPGIAAIMIWGFMYKAGDTGVLNILLGKLGKDSQLWLSNSSLTIPLIVLSMTWKSAGSTALVYMAAMSNISPELYEAAALDGARPLQRFRKITLPSILGLGKTMLIMQIISVFQILYEPLMLTNGGPNNASTSLMFLVFKYAFQDFNYPAAAAISVVICLILVVLTIIYFKVTKRVQNEE